MSALPLHLPQPTEDERTSALLVHVLAIVSGFIALLVFFLVKKDSLFVKFHTLQVLIWHAVYMVLCMFAVMGMFIVMSFYVAPQAEKNTGPPLAFFGVFGTVWLLIIGGALANLS